MTGPQVPFCDDLHATKYRGEGEDHREAMGRNASAMADDEEHFQAIREIYTELRFLNAGRVQAAMGSTKKITASNCYVSGTIEDSYVDGHGSIIGRVWDAAKTMRMGGGIGYDFSTIRPRGALIKKLQSQASGPVSFMDIYDAVCRCTASSGHRRGAQMGVLRCDHPDIEEFIRAKQNKTRLTGFNTSVAITDRFMECLESGEPFPLTWGGEVHREVDAKDLWEMIMRSTYDWAEPGVLFIDTINRMNNLYYCEEIAATNPCGEQPLPPYGACLLGSFNLVKYLKRYAIGKHEFDWELFKVDIPPVVRALDNVIDRSHYPLYEQEKEARAKRRLGIGVTGVANCIEALGYSYGGVGFIRQLDEILSCLSNETYRASAMLASEKGPFPLFDASMYLTAPFVMGLDEDVQQLIAEHGIRNSHLTSIAPTGTISWCADNVSSSIEPVFSYSCTRILQTFDGPEKVVVEDYGYRVLGTRGKTSEFVTPDEHLAVLACASRHVDSAVSKTCNVPKNIPWDDFKNIYVDAWRMGCKGCTTYRSGGLREAVIDVEAAGTGTDGVACYIDPTTGRKECE